MTVYSTNPELFKVDNWFNIDGYYESTDGKMIAPFHWQAERRGDAVYVYRWKTGGMTIVGRGYSETTSRKYIGSVNVKKNGEVGTRTSGDVPHEVKCHKFNDGDVLVEGWRLGWKFNTPEHEARVFKGN